MNQLQTVQDNKSMGMLEKSVEVLEKTFAVAEKLSKITGFIPDHLKGKPTEIAAAILTGSELGLPAMTSIRSLYVIRGRVGFEYPIIVGLLRKAGYKINWLQSTNEVAEVKLIHPNDETSIVVKWTIVDAKNAGLAGKDIWKNHPATMLRARAISNAARAFAGEIFSGVYMPDEIEEIAENSPENLSEVKTVNSGVEGLGMILDETEILEGEEIKSDQDNVSEEIPAIPEGELFEGAVIIDDPKDSGDYKSFVRRMANAKSVGGKDGLKFIWGEVETSKITTEEKENLKVVYLERLAEIKAIKTAFPDS